MGRKNVTYFYAGANGQEFVLCREEAREYPWHFHARHWTFGVLHSGFATISTVQGVFPLSGGQTFIIAPLAPHRLSIREQSTVAVLCSEEPYGYMNSQSHYLSGSQCTGSVIPDILDRLSASDGNPDLFVQTMDLDESSPTGAVRRLLADSPDVHFPLTDLAMQAGYSTWHFLRLFKKKTGFTPHAFQLIHRLSLARTLLRTGTAAAEAAVASGFTDQSHLHKFFKLHHGLTPRQFTEAGVIL